MEWQIKTISQKSTLSGESFTSGDLVVSLIFKDRENGNVCRADLRPEEVEMFDLSDELIGRWTRVVQESDDESVYDCEKIESAEDFFLSLFENENTIAGEESDMLKHLLSLMLERKRVLRAIGNRKSSDEQRYLHVKTKREITVPIRNISAELMLKIEDAIGNIIF